jgi:hypothetical protein
MTRSENSHGISKYLPWFLAFIVLFCAAGSYLFTKYPPGWSREVRLTFEEPCRHSKGFEYKFAIPQRILRSSIGSDSNGRGLSPLTLWENGRELTPAHSFRKEIQESGRGAFLHWSETLFFSASDNSDPVNNGRVYEIGFRTPLPLIIYVGVLFSGYVLAILFLMVLLRSRSQNRWAATVSRVAIILISVGVLEVTFWLLTEHQLSKYGPFVHKAYRHIISGSLGEADAPDDAGLRTNYSPHHYLNYVLNPRISYGGTKQFNAVYLIRRSAPIEPEKKDKWRLLVLGGSTTFCEGIANERDTWPYLLECMVRAECGQNCEVINCGVGGYTLLENYLHYVVLLKALNPDAVLFYTGINDVIPRLFGEISTDYSNYRVPWRAGGSEILQADKWLSFSHTYKYYLLNKEVIDKLYQGIGGQVSKKCPRPSEWSNMLKRNGATVYRDHLDGFLQLLKSENVKVAILPQHFSPRTDPDEAFASGVQEHNLVNEYLAKKHGFPFASELLSPNFFDKNDTLDSCHFNEDGSRKMALAVMSFMMKNGMLPIRTSF